MESVTSLQASTGLQQAVPSTGSLEELPPYKSARLAHRGSGAFHLGST